MGIRLWLDDVRPMPEGFNVWCKSAYTCMDIIRQGEVEFIDFDHDLGEALDGYWVALLIEYLASQHHLMPIKWNIHSANPAGRKRIEQAMKSAERFWNENKG
jgi:hypothetical protein